MMKKMGLSWLAAGGRMEKGELRWLLVKEGLPLACEGRRRCWNRLEREKPSSWPARRREKSDEEGVLCAAGKGEKTGLRRRKKTKNPPGGGGCCQKWRRE
jgi:hypothetical protein